MGQAAPYKRLYLFPADIHSRAGLEKLGFHVRDQRQVGYGGIHLEEKEAESIVKDLRELLEGSQKLNTDIKKLLKESTYLEYDDLCMLDINHKDAEQILLQEQLCKVMQELEDVSARLDYLALPIKEVSRLHKNSDGRYETKSGHCYTSGCRVEALISDGFQEVPYWVRTSIEHDGKDYYLVGYRQTELEGLKVRLRGRA